MIVRLPQSPLNPMRAYIYKRNIHKSVISQKVNQNLKIELEPAILNYRQNRRSTSEFQIFPLTMRSVCACGLCQPPSINSSPLFDVNVRTCVATLRQDPFAISISADLDLNRGSCPLSSGIEEDRRRREVADFAEQRRQSLPLNANGVGCETFVALTDGTGEGDCHN